MRKVLVVLFLVFSLSACNFLPTPSEGELLEAPMLNQLQQEVYDTLSATLDTSQLVYKYPQTGEHRSPFIFYDIDGNGKQEAVIFYAYKDSPQRITARILRQDANDNWRDFYDIPGKGSQVEFVAFAPLIFPNSSSLIIGWSSGTRSSKTITIHHLGKNGMIKQMEEKYHAYHIGNYTGTSTSQLLLVQSSGEKYFLNYFAMDGNSLKELDSTVLYEETTAVPQIITGKLPDNSFGIYVDEEMAWASTSYGTEVFTIFNNRIITLAGSSDGKQPETGSSIWEAYTQTFRTVNELSADRNSDGIIEVPREWTQSDISNIDDDVHAINLVEYMEYIGNGFEVKYTAAVNKEAGYMFYFPDKWIDNVIIEKDLQRQEWLMYKVDKATGKADTLLLKIRRYYASDYIDSFSKYDTLLATRGLYSYYCSIPQTTNEPLAITAEEVKELFMLI